MNNNPVPVEELYIGVLSGTSMDAVDVALVSFDDSTHYSADHSTSHSRTKLLNTLSYPIPESFLKHCLHLSQSGNGSIDDYGRLDAEAGEIFAEAVLTLLKAANVPAHKIRAIGSHGQTLRHRPEAIPPFTLQIGDPNIIAERTEIPTIADFRRRDIAAGGQGAPLAPGFHAAVFGFDSAATPIPNTAQTAYTANSSNILVTSNSATINTFRKDNPTIVNDRVIVNIGGISNITILNKDPAIPIIGFDTGPGNCLMDLWAKTHWDVSYDKDGKIAAEGNVQIELLNILLQDPFFEKSPPKSTGRDYFNQQWLVQYLNTQSTLPTFRYHDKDIQATLLALTAHSLSNAIIKHAPANAEVYICGGGVHNKHLLETLRKLLSRPVESTERLGLPPDWIEAILFAWLAKQTLEGKSGNCPSVTGARRAIPLGGIFGFRPTVSG